MPSTCKPSNLLVKATHSQAVSLLKFMDPSSKLNNLGFPPPSWFQEIPRI